MKYRTEDYQMPVTSHNDKPKHSREDIMAMVKRMSTRDVSAVARYRPAVTENDIAAIATKHCENADRRDQFAKALIELIEVRVPFWLLFEHIVRVPNKIEREKLRRVHESTVKLIQSLLALDSKPLTCFIRDLLPHKPSLDFLLDFEADCMLIARISLKYTKRRIGAVPKSWWMCFVIDELADMYVAATNRRASGRTSSSDPVKTGMKSEYGPFHEFLSDVYLALFGHTRGLSSDWKEWATIFRPKEEPFDGEALEELLSETIDPYWSMEKTAPSGPR